MHKREMKLQVSGSKEYPNTRIELPMDFLRVSELKKKDKILLISDTAYSTMLIVISKKLYEGHPSLQRKIAEFLEEETI